MVKIQKIDLSDFRHFSKNRFFEFSPLFLCSSVKITSIFLINITIYSFQLLKKSIFCQENLKNHFFWKLCISFSVILSDWTGMLGIIETHLKMNKIPYKKITGETKANLR